MSDQTRNYCLVPDCDEQPYPGDTVCLTHQREDDQYRCRAQRNGVRCTGGIFHDASMNTTPHTFGAVPSQEK